MGEGNELRRMTHDRTGRKSLVALLTRSSSRSLLPSDFLSPIPLLSRLPWSLLPSPLPSPPEARSDDGRSEGNRSDEPARSGMNGGGRDTMVSSVLVSLHSPVSLPTSPHSLRSLSV